MRFSSDSSVFWLIPWAVVCVVLASWLYSNVGWLNELPKKWKLLFKALRSLTLFFLGILLVGIIFESTNYKIEKPIIISLIDNSSSMKNYKDSMQVSSQLSAFKESLRQDLGENYEMVEMNVGATAEYATQSTLKDILSNHSEGFEKINTDFYNRNIGGIIFVSDGNFNAGNNPIYAAEKIHLTPIFTLGVGDTVPKRDHYIKNSATNDVAFYKNKFPIEVDIEAIKMGKTSATVSILKNGKSIASQSINYTDGKRDFAHLTFLLEANEIGFQTYTVTVSNATNESNYTNNRRTFYIEVIDSRNKILLLSGAPHPDIAAMKEVLEEDKNNEVEVRLISTWNKELAKTNLVIWHEPGVDFDPSIQAALMAKNIPTLYCLGPQTSNSVIQKLNIGLFIAGGNQSDETQGTVNDAFQQFDLSQETKKAIAFFPPLKTKFGEVKVSGGAETAIYQSIGTIRKKDPLLFFNKRGKTTYGVLLGEGLWAWKVNDFVRTKSFTAFTELIHKTTQYLVVKQNASALTVTLPKRFTKAEDVIFNATFYNDAMQAITTPLINLTLTDDQGKKSNLQFAVAGEMYKLSLGKLNAGKYTWKATTAYNGKTHLKSGVFIVEDITLERLDSYANHAILHQLSEKTTGKFELLKNYKKILSAIKSRGDITSLSYKETSFNDLIDYKILSLILLLLLTTEWFLRRWFGGY